MTVVTLGVALLLASTGNAAAQTVPLLEVLDTSGPILLVGVEIYSDGTLSRKLDYLGTKEESHLEPQERYRLGRFLGSTKLQRALEALDSTPGPFYTDGDDVALVVRGETHGYSVGCKSLPEEGRELVDLVNEILVRHFGHAAQLRLPGATCSERGVTPNPPAPPDVVDRPKGGDPRGRVGP